MQISTSSPPTTVNGSSSNPPTSENTLRRIDRFAPPAQGTSQYSSGHKHGALNTWENSATRHNHVVASPSMTVPPVTAPIGRPPDALPSSSSARWSTSMDGSAKQSESRNSRYG